MTRGTAASRCHACGKAWISGCVITHTCRECEAKGHGGIFDCPACEKMHEDGVLKALSGLAQERDRYKLVLETIAKTGDCCALETPHLTLQHLVALAKNALQGSIE